MKKTLFAFSLFIVLIVATPHSLALAYRAEEPTAIRVTDTHVLFSIPFTAGFLNRTSLTPMMVSSDTNVKNAVLVSIKDGSDTINQVPMRALILADNLKLESGYYRVPLGERESFNLIAVAEIPKGKSHHRLIVDKFPYLLIDEANVMTATTVSSPFLETLVTPNLR